MCFAPQRRALFRKSTSEPPKVDRTWCVLYILTSKCASRHNGVHFFESRHLSLQKWSEHVVFCTFSLGNVLRATTACTFSTSQLPKVVRHWCVLYVLTWKCASRHNGVHFFSDTFSTSQRTKVVRTWCVLYILTWKCASRHNGVHFLISHLASCLRTRRFSEPTFPPSGATNHWKNTGNRDFQCFTTFLPFRASASSFF